MVSLLELTFRSLLTQASALTKSSICWSLILEDGVWAVLGAVSDDTTDWRGRRPLGATHKSGDKKASDEPFPVERLKSALQSLFWYAQTDLSIASDKLEINQLDAHLNPG